MGGEEFENKGRSQRADSINYQVSFVKATYSNRALYSKKRSDDLPNRCHAREISKKKKNLQV